MNVTEYFEVTLDCVFFRPVGKVPFQEAVQLVRKAVTFACERRIPNLCINTTGLTGFPSPTLADRYFAVREWAEAANTPVRVAMIVPAEMIDPEKFGVTVARNAGLNANVFATEPEDLARRASEPGL